MFGYVVANPDALSPEDKRAYKACYCGVCRELSLRHGAAARAALQYDMAFLALVLSDAYCVPFAESEARCAAHPTHEHAEFRNELCEYAADMNVALAYYKALDDWRDEKMLYMLAAAKLLKPHCENAEKRFPRQCAKMRACIAELSRMEQAGEPSPDEPARAFGALMGELFVYKEDDKADALRAFGDALGRFVYCMDAACDLRKDILRKRYNPLIALSRAQIRDSLDALMANCLEKYSALALARYGVIYENILYSGVWTRYEAGKAKRGEKKG